MKYKLVKQHSEEDCGAASIASICQKDRTKNADTLLLNSNLPPNSPFSLPSSTENYSQPKFIREDKSDTPIVFEDKADSLIHQPRTNVLTSVDENDFMPAISPWTRLGGLFLVGTVGIAIAIAAFTPYNMTVKAEAKVRPTGELRIVEAKTEGTVVAISELQQLGRDIEQTIIKAPESGVLFQLSLRNPSQTVQPGSEIAQTAPKQTSLAVEALVSSSDIGKVQIDQEAQVRISACPYPDYGTLPGIVKKISPDAIPVVSNPNSPNNQNVSPTNTASFYRVQLQPEYLTLSQRLLRRRTTEPALTVGQGINKCRIQLGMEGRADIVTTEETLLKFLLRKAKLLTDLS